MPYNKCIKFAPFGRPIRKSEALLLSAYAQRYTAIRIQMQAVAISR